jgi:hypothetical protein
MLLLLLVEQAMLAWVRDGRERLPEASLAILLLWLWLLVR